MKFGVALLSLLTVVAAMPPQELGTRATKQLVARVECYEGGLACPRAECAKCKNCGGTQLCLAPEPGKAIPPTPTEGAKPARK